MQGGTWQLTLQRMIAYLLATGQCCNFTQSTRNNVLDKNIRGESSKDISCPAACGPLFLGCGLNHH